MASQFFPLKDVMMKEPFVLFIQESHGPCLPPGGQVLLSFSSQGETSVTCHTASKWGNRIFNLGLLILKPSSLQ